MSEVQAYSHVLASFLESSRNILTGSPVNFAVIAMLLGSTLAGQFKKQGTLQKLGFLVLFGSAMIHEILHSAQTKDNHLKLLGITG